MNLSSPECREGTLDGASYYAIPALSASLLKALRSGDYEKFLERWKALKGGYEIEEDEETSAMRAGTMLDDLVFNPAKKYAPKPTKGYKQGQTHDDEGNEWIAPKTYKSMHAAYRSVADSVFWGLLKPGPNWHQFEMQAVHTGTGYLLKCRSDSVSYWDTDCWVGRRKPITDLKKTTALNQSKWLYNCENMGHYVQAAVNLELARACGLDCKEFLHVTLAEDWPYRVRAFKLLQADMPDTDYVESLPWEMQDAEYKCHEMHAEKVKELDQLIFDAVDVIENGLPAKMYYISPLPPRPSRGSWA